MKKETFFSDVEIGEIFENEIVWSYIIPNAMISRNGSVWMTWFDDQLMYTWNGRDKDIFLQQGNSIIENDGTFCMRILSK